LNYMLDNFSTTKTLLYKLFIDDLSDVNFPDLNNFNYDFYKPATSLSVNCEIYLIIIPKM